jgi:hypothetical protein
MEMVGEEKRIQALFSEVRLADAQTTPSFARVWNRAQAKTVRTQRAFKLSFVAATALLVCALVSLALWSSRWQPNRIAIAPVTGPVVVNPVTGTVAVNDKGGNNHVTAPKVLPKRGASYSKSNAIKFAARREAVLVAANKKAASEAKAIASWESPTATLLDSQSDGLLKSLPHLNQTVDELKSFLPSQPK